MSFKNYKNVNFLNNQSLSYQDLNNLNSNDIILNNKIKNMPRGILALKEVTFINQFNTFNTSTNPSIDDDQDFGYKMLRESVTKNFVLNFACEDLRLLKFGFFCSTFKDAFGNYKITAQNNTANAPKRGRGILELAFFLEENNENKYILNSTFRTNQIMSTVNQGCILMTYTGQVPAGSHKLSVGAKGQRSLITLGQYDVDSSGGYIFSSGTASIMQLYVEDLGGYTAPGSDNSNDI